jgi:SAM-dependent methyltransferase
MSDFQSFFGNPDVTTYDECLKIFDFAEMTSDDVFYDLGCGYGTVCIAAAENRNPKKNIGIEARIENFFEATNRVLEKGKGKNIILENKFIENVDFSDATLIYYSIKPNLNHILHLMKMIQEDCRVITPKIPIPSIKPKKNIKINNSNFFLTEGPLKKNKANNIKEWKKFIPDYNNTDKIELNKNNTQWLDDLLFQIYSN